MACDAPGGKQQRALTGVVSFGIGCGMDGAPGIYTDVRYYLKWIRKFTQDIEIVNP